MSVERDMWTITTRTPAWVAALLWAGLTPGLGAQSVILEAGYRSAQVFQEDWQRMDGLGFGVTLPHLVGPFDLSLELDRSTRGSGQVSEWCNFVACVPGPFDEELTLLGTRLRLGGRLLKDAPVEVALSADAVLVHQGRYLTRTDNGDDHTDAALTDLGLGATALVTLPPMANPFRPVLRVSYARIFESLCAADSACYPGRNMISVGLGVAWHRR